MKFGVERIFEIEEALSKTSFYKMPASTKYHNNFQGGLRKHSMGVWKNLLDLTEKLGLKWEHPESPYVIGMLHDACKIDAYFYNPDYCVWECSENYPEGHADVSLEVIDSLGIELTEEERTCIRWHMGAFDDTDNWGKYTEAIHKYPNVLWTHVADMMATHIDEVTKDEKEKRCCICGKSLENEYGNNAWPIVDDGTCCDECNKAVVQARLTMIANK